MRHQRAICRSILVAGLAICVNVSNYYPQLLAVQWRMVHPEFARTNTACCCGTADGKCCGKACCQSPGKSESAPVAPIRSNHPAEPLGLWITGLGSLGQGAIACSILDASLKDDSLIGFCTLVELSIRINT